MAANASEPTPVQLIQHERFTTKQLGYRLRYLSLDLPGNIAVSGDHFSSGQTYIDLYSGNNSDSRDKLKLFYSKEFEKYSNYSFRYVSFLNKSVSKLVTCIGDKIEIIDTKNESKVLQSCRVNGETTCLTVKEKDIFIGLEDSQTVFVFNNDLKEMKKISIEGIQDGDYPGDLQVIKDTVFVCTGRDGRALSLSVYDGSIVSEYTYTTGMYSSAYSITVSEEMNLVAVLWGGRRIIVYSLNKKKSFVVLDVDSIVHRIRISDRDRMIITGNRNTGEIKMYDLEQLFNFEAMKKTLAYIVSPDECEKLRKCFGVTEQEMGRLETGDENKSKKLSDKQKTVKRMEWLLTIIEEKGHLNPYNINTLTDAVSTLGDEICISNLKGPMEGYSLYGIIKVMYKDLEAEMMTRQDHWDDERNHLSSKLETAENEVKEHKKTVDDLQGELVRVTKQAQEQEKTLKEDLKNGELKIQKLEGEKMTLTEELQQSSKQMETLTEEVEQNKQSKVECDRQIVVVTEELAQVKRESSEKIGTLTLELHETKQKLFTRIKESEKTNNDLELTKQTLKETTQDRDITRTELRQYQLDFAKESKALKEVLNQVKEIMAELQRRSAEGKPLVDSEETTDEGGTILVAAFGRLIVAIAEHLTLNDCLKLVKLFDIPSSDCDKVCRVSVNESSGMKILDVLKKRKVINMYDVTNLQKALTMLQLEAVNYDLVEPYQNGIDEEKYELNKVEEMYTWEDVHFFNAAKDDLAQRQIRNDQTSPIDDTTEPEYAPKTEAAPQHAEAGDGGRRSLLRDRYHHLLYTEQSIGREGGTMHLGNVSLTVPPNAIHESFVIALSVMNESPFPLDREVDTARMTPLFKLEPLGLMFKKSLQLNIPHSALISEPENHDVIIYSGQGTKNNGDSSDSIEWTKDISIPRQLKEKSVTVDIQCLTYLSASLVSQTSVPPVHIVRAVPFVNGVRNADDDIILTICFCSDNDSEYNMLLSDYNTKLPLEQYSTIQLCRHPERDEDDAGFLSVAVTSHNNTYVADGDQAVKFSISHLCTASRVSHQLRLQKNKDIDRDDIQVSLTFSQAESTSTKIFMKTRIKDLMISKESAELLLGSVSTDLKPYEELKANISSMLENYHCIQLATYFDLTPAETERVKIDASPGRILMKILDEREKIMPQKMFGLYQGLKVCHLNKIARRVFEYIERNSNETQQENHKNEKGKCAKGMSENASVSQRPLQKRQTQRSGIDKSVQTTVTATSSSSDSVLKMLNQELCLDEEKTSDILSITRRPHTTLKWVKEHRGIMMRYLLPMLVDGILQIQRGIFTLPQWFKN
ncbi:hypothetical protein HOLleu_36492 [Holothuria leucospilota]|uniref:ZU5 domain-containing protein n=1 Tax=Holothuria leucospilota TaxID=206669 RepID=A0A9Q0YJV9_HOLLE|nr:hypothetical protein HOLleu_36492 [Holothuria leucospilota]